MKLFNRVLQRFAKARGFKISRGRRDFTGADAGRLYNDWILGPGASRNEKIRRSLTTLRARCRDLAENDDYARKFVSLCKTNIAGSNGIKLSMDVTDPGGRPDKFANDSIEAAFTEWSTARNCTVQRNLTWRGVQHLLLETAPTDGEILIRKVRGFDNPFGFALQLFPSDSLDLEYNDTLTDGSTVRMGVERNSWKEPVAYHVLTDDPSDVWYSSTYRFKRQRIPASDIIHAFIPTAINQVRGFPWMHSAMARMQMLNGYEEASLVAARAAACQSGFFQQRSDPNSPPPNYEGDATDSNGNPIQEMEPGAYRTLPAGIEFKEHNPSYPHTEFTQFTKQILRGISSGLLVSYNTLSNDLESVNYSSIRAGLLEEREMWMLLQIWFIDTVVLPIFEDWLLMALTSGRIPLPASKFSKFNAPIFNGRRWPWIDPMKDVQARILAIQNNLDTHSGALAEQGRDIEDVLRTKQKEEDLSEIYGIPLTATNTVPPQKPGAETPTDPGEE